MPSDSMFVRDEDNNIAIRVVSNTGVSAEPDSVFTRDEDGNVAMRVTTSGGGGSDPHNLGWYATPQALSEAHATAEAGDFAIVGSTDTVWVWDTDSSSWKDTDTKGQVTSVNNQTGDITIKTINNNELVGSGNIELSTYLPYPAGWTTNSTTKAFCDIIAADTAATVGKAYLGEVTFSDLPASMVNGEVIVEIMSGTTSANKVIVLSLKSGNVSPYAWQYVYWDGGTNVSGWKTFGDTLPSQTGNAGKFLMTDGTDASWSDKPLTNLATGTSSLSIIGQATARPYSVVIGELAKGAASNGSSCVAVGVQAYATGNSSTAIGKSSEAIDTECVAIGNGAKAYGIGSVQIKYGTNNTPNTVQIGSYTVMSADGTIPTDRLTKVNTTITLTAAGWNSNTQTVSVTGMTATGVVFPSPDPADQSAYTSAGILCTAQAAGTLTFTCDTVPSGDIDVNVVML